MAGSQDQVLLLLTGRGAFRSLCEGRGAPSAQLARSVSVWRDRSLHRFHAFCLHCDYIEYEAQIAVQRWNEQYITEHENGYYSD